MLHKRGRGREVVVMVWSSEEGGWGEGVVMDGGVE